MKVIIFAIMFILIFGCIDTPSREELRDEAIENYTKENQTLVNFTPITVDDITNFSIEFSNYEYKSGELMKIEVTVVSEKQVSGIVIKLIGMENSRRQDLLQLSQDVTLNEGENVFSYSYSIPQCSSCTGLRKGRNSVEASLYQGEELLASDTESVTIK